MNSLPDQECRLCAGAVEPKFSLRVLEKHNVQYSQCRRCGSLQTEPPHWLREAYASNNLSCLDTGAAHRNLQNFAACWAICKLLGLRDALDVGGGDGLLCRLLRDREINCFVRDRYAAPTYAQGFENPRVVPNDLRLAFEVFGHYPDPSKDLAEVFADGPQVILASTAVYAGQNQSWWYLAPQSGQHVFFYSRAALLLIAKKFEYDLTMSGGYLLFTRPAIAGPVKFAMAKRLLKRRCRELVNAVAALMPARGVWNDHLLQVERVESTRRDSCRGAEDCR